MKTMVRRKCRFSRTALAWTVFCTCLSIAGAPRANAQGTRVEGVVRDTSGASVPNAQVELRAKSYSATANTDASGVFVFENVPGDQGTLSITAKNMKTVQRNWSSASGTPVHVEVVLEPLSLTQRIMVTATRSETPLGQAPISDIQLTKEDVRTTPALTLDDTLRQVPGFSLFRRTSSRTANPTTMGVSLRGLGASGASRALVLNDGIPLNDPFGSWIYWDRVPRASVESIEFAQEGASSLYGSSALGGVIQFLTRPYHPSGIAIETSYGNQDTQDVSLSASGQYKRWYGIVAGEAFRTDGYFLVPEAYRGTMNTRAATRHGTADVTIGRKIGARSVVFARGSFFNDSRNNGIVGETNDIRLGEGALGANLDLGTVGTFTLRFYGDAQTYHQQFYSVAFDQNSAALVNSQTVPAQRVGGSAVWSRSLGQRHTLVAGFDEHEEIGHSHERIFSSSTGNPLRLNIAGGSQRTIGLFGEDLIQLAPGWLLSLSARYDNWRNFDASALCTPFRAPCPPDVSFAARSYDAFSPRATLLNQLNSHVSWSASVYRAFRAPTLNELYRGFRQANNQVNANAYLRAERLTGGEAGVAVTGWNRHIQLRGTFFFNEIINSIANVSCQVPDPSPLCPQPPPPNTNEFVRENLGRTSAPGVEISAIGQITDRLQLSGGYQYVDAKVISAPGQPSLLNTWVAQIPHNVLTFQARYSDPSRISFSVAGRMIGLQYDTNQLPLDRYFVLDAMISRRVAFGIEAFGAAENVFNTQYIATAGTSLSPPQIGLPVVVHCGIRYDFPKR